MKTDALYNSRITKNYVEYLKKHHPAVDVHALLEYAGMTPYQIEDGGHWFTQNQVDRFHEAITMAIPDPDISREAGRFSALSAAAGDVQQYALSFVNPSIAYRMLSRIFTRASRACLVSTKNLGKQQIEITVRLKPGVIEKPYQCDNRLGTLEAIGRLFTDKFAQIDHDTCVHKGGDACRYVVSWEVSPSHLWKQLRNASLLVGAALAAVLFFFMEETEWVVFTLSAITIVSLLSLGLERVEKTEVETALKKKGERTGELLDRINTSYNNTLLVNEIGQATASILNTKDLLRSVMNSMERLLDFDRGLVLLANPERTRLLYADGYGYNTDESWFLRNTAFHLDKPGSKGPFIVSFKEQKPFLVDNVEQIRPELSAKSYEYARFMGVKAFACVPILYEGRAEGILAVDNFRSQRTMSQSDLNLLQGIAPQIGISINRVRDIEKIRESEERFRTLGENAPDIIYTLDSEGTYTYVNPAWETLLGHKIGEVVGKSFSDFVSTEEVSSYSRIFRRIREKGETVKSEMARIIGRDGSERLFSISACPNADSSGQLTGIVGTMKDMTALEKSHATLQAALQSTIKAISDIVESRDPYTAGHQRHVRELSAAIAEEMGLSDERIQGLQMAALIHDIGKMQIPAEILSKPGRLSAIEMSLIQTHPDVGFRVLRNIEFHHPVAQIVHQHHERFDGSGYPGMLSGNEILLEARILAVADVVEAMMNHRPYRPALGIEKALDEIVANRGTYYDPEVADACLRLFREKSFVLK
ncbi:MAG: PAS domain S-box protein [Syntrophaceae bacterium]|nr:PAS domain S-box protein [Syntrophaceae bacterium]